MDMEFERPRDSRELDMLKNRGVETSDSKEKVKTPLSQIYQRQVENIKLDYGDLEQIRGSLGLSRRQICQMLMVDPSAWTRWTKTTGGAPPHVYRSLQWLMELEKQGSNLTGIQELRMRSDLAKEGLKIKDLGNTVHQLKKGDSEKIRRLKALVYLLAASQFVTWALLLIRLR